ncbi:MAG: copper amine oxidase N-terminal domain-containing protein [Bacillota bacterium]|nr:copper amine oxidase N-terminal domain-containing protein [Bacillota bacterium]
MTAKFARFLTAVLVLLMVVGLAGAAWASEPVPGAEITEPQVPGTTIIYNNVKLWIGQNKAVVNGESKTLDTAPMLYEDRTMVPLRFIAESLGANVQWDPAEQKIMIATGGESGPAEKTQFDVILKIGQNQAFVNSEPKTLDVPPMLYKGRTMVPLRFIAEALGADVQWDPAEQCVTITLRLMPIDAFITATTKGFNAEIKAAMQEAARQAKIKLAEAEPVEVIGKESQLTKPNVKVVSIAIQGADTLTIEQLAKGADVLFTFLQLPEGSELSSGFYVIRISGDPKANKWVAQFKNMDGKVVLEKPAEVGAGARALPGGKVKVTVKISFPGPTVTLDIHWNSASIQTAFGIGNGGPDTTPLLEAGQKVVQAVEKYAVSVNDALTQAAKKYENGILDGWMSSSRGDDLLVAHTVFEGVNDLTIEELTKGQDVFFGYFRTPKGSKLPAGFYKVRIVQESGRWLGRFVNDKGEVVYEGPAEVTAGGDIVKSFWNGWFTHDVGLNSVTGDYHWIDRKGREHSIEITITVE